MATLCRMFPLQVAELDLAQFKSVHEFAAQWSRRPVHVLINNAGVFSMGGQYDHSSFTWNPSLQDLRMSLDG